MGGVAEGIRELFREVDVTDVVLEVMYHGVFFIVLVGKIIKKIFVVDAFFLFLLCAQKKKETKRKSAGCRSGAKFFTLSLKKKNSLTLKQLFLLHGKEQKILHAPPLKAGPPTEDSTSLCSLRWMFRRMFSSMLSNDVFSMRFAV